jgi:hypothetical protein
MQSEQATTIGETVAQALSRLERLIENSLELRNLCSGSRLVTWKGPSIHSAESISDENKTG